VRRRALLRESHAPARRRHLVSHLYAPLATSHWCLHARLAASTPELLRATSPPPLSRATSPSSCGTRRAPSTHRRRPPSGNSGPRPPRRPSDKSAVVSSRPSSSLHLRTPGNEDRLRRAHSPSSRASTFATSSDKSARAAVERERVK
jgi:hypothetical protein